MEKMKKIQSKNESLDKPLGLLSNGDCVVESIVNINFLLKPTFIEFTKLSISPDHKWNHPS